MFEFGISGMGSNGFMNMVMQNDVAVQEAFAEFEETLRDAEVAISPILVFQNILEEKGIKEKDLTYADKQRMKRIIEKVSAGGFYNE